MSDTRTQEEELVLTPLTRVVEEHGIDPLAARLIELRTWLADDLTPLEASIDAFDREALAAEPELPDVPGILGRKAARHLLDRPGKRIRSLCVLLAARMGGLKLDARVRDLAIACEMVHAATLLHDDVIDEGTERRGAAAARMIYGNSASILGGDHLLIEALRFVERSGSHSLLKELLDVISEMVGAEAMQLEQRMRFTPNRDVYLKVIDGKTAALFRWGLAAGGHAANLSREQVDAMGRAGTALGMAFQLIDDVIDLEGEDTGKDPLADLREGKLTWPVIIAAERDRNLSAELRERVSDAEPLNPDEGRDIVARIRSTGALEATRAFAEFQGERARNELESLPRSMARTAMSWVVDAAIHRKR